MMKLNKIIISRTDAIGDVILTLPLAAYIKQHFPKCEVVFLGKDYTKSIIENCFYIDKFVSWDEISENAITNLKKINADAIIHVFAQSAIAKAAHKADIPIRIGTSHRTYHWTNCNRIISFSRKRSNLHEAQLNFFLLKGLKINYIPSMGELLLMPILDTNQPLRENLKILLKEEKQKIILHPGSKRSAREWGIDRFVELVKLLPKDKFQIFVTGTEKEGLLFRKSLVMPFTDVIDLTGNLSLQELTIFIKHCDILIAESTGPLHIAAALGINAIGIYPPIRPMHPGRWAPVGKKTKVFVAEKKCSDCKKTNKCLCMRNISAQQIADYINSL